jgi:hypothetical protein
VFSTPPAASWESACSAADRYPGRTSIGWTAPASLGAPEIGSVLTFFALGIPAPSAIQARINAEKFNQMRCSNRRYCGYENR